MTAGLRPYPEYKGSGLPWLGKVPSHWQLRRAKYLLRELDRRWNKETGTLLSVSQYTGVTKRRLREGSDEPDTRASSLFGYKVAEPQDLVVNIMLAWNGSLGIAPCDGLVSPAYCVYRFRLGNPWFFHHLLRSAVLRAEIKRRSRGVVESRLRLYTDDLFRIPLPEPPIEEQSAIVRYLELMDRRINRFIRNRQRLIGVLNEQKRAIINRAVTRGLDPNVPLKSSDIDWLSDIPENWQVCRLRNVVSQVTSGSRGWSSYAADEGPLFLRIANLRRMSLQLRFDDVIRLNLPETSEAQRTQVQGGDILVSITAYIGSIAVVPSDLKEAYISQHVALCRPRDDRHNPLWLGYVLLSEIGQTHGRLSLYGGTKDGLSLDDVKNYPLLLPPRDEQDKLVERIELQLESTKTAIDRAQREIDLIREYRSRLIADVVTGKVDVRHLPPPLEAMAAEAGPEDLDEGLDDDIPGEDETELAQEVTDADD